MHDTSEAAARILEIEARQDAALRQLEDLERQVAAVLAEYLPSGERASIAPVFLAPQTAADRDAA